MVSNTKRPGAKAATPAKRRRPRATLTETKVPAAEPADKPNPLRAGLKALRSVRDDVVQRRSRVFEAILGIDPAQGLSGLIKRDAAAGKEAFGLRKFEAVFDQRVMQALEREGMPPVGELRALASEVTTLKAELRRLKAAAKRAR